MSAYGTKRTSGSRSVMSAFGGKADIISVLAGDLVKRCKGKAVTGAQARLLLLSVIIECGYLALHLGPAATLASDTGS